MSITEQDGRLQSELELLEAMYPDQVTYNTKAREIKYTADNGSFTLRLPSGYLKEEMPVVLAATIGRSDAREQLRQEIKASNPGEEVLDSIITTFNGLIEARSTDPNEGSTTRTETGARALSRKATVIAWLHHLLNTNKSKQALSPPHGVSGVTKPGCPGVLIYTGPYDAVHEHVNGLKGLHWQAFQVRLESGEEWSFAHGDGVKEVESMKDAVAEVGEDKKDEFMEAMRMREGRCRWMSLASFCSLVPGNDCVDDMGRGGMHFSA